ncbi:MFS transporter [Rhizobium tropici]|uniref:MFS family arabinose efflux permease n=1 Tax=Rhizobium tropici TaxID=398 RepID=A0ABR6R421_RHITR|nr:MFS transporter [Rhizobium tropici]MBB6493925.1 putative MFS family arabinose efflux permease [Rhizobium tropici]
MTSASSSPDVTSRQVLLFSLAAAVMVANIYYSQPLLAVIGQAFGVSPTHAGYLVTLTQLGDGLGVLLIVPLGDGLGVLLIVPLGDGVDRRKLTSIMLAGCVIALAAATLSPSFLIFAVVQLLIGTTASATMVVIPYVASHSSGAQRGRRVGQVITGLLLGILLARTVSGFVSDLIGWRWMYALAAFAVASLWVMLRRTMVANPQVGTLVYSNLMRSLMVLFRAEPELRRRSIYAMLGMGSFSTLWTGLTLLLTSAPYHYSPSTIGLFGVIGAAGALSAGIAGRLGDRGLANTTTCILAVALITSWGLVAAGGTSLPLLITGILVLDVAVMGLQVTHQSILYRLAPDSQSRITSIFVTAGFIGMSMGSALGSFAFAHAGWMGLCIVGTIMPIILLTHWVVTGILAPGFRPAFNRSDQLE